jgi:two-component system sensor histidine kinase KdpD
LDSARHLEECRPGRDTSYLPSTDEILAATAHELRLPLSHIKGFVTSLRRTDVDWDEDTRSEFIAEIDLETDRLAQLVESLCTPRSAAERGLDARTPHVSYNPGPELTFAHPAAVVQGALHRIRALLEDRLLRLDVSPCLDSVPLDASQMERVLANLIQNAIKYSPPGRPIGVSAWLNDANELEFSVEDEGPGIRPEDRDRIFDPFFRSQTTLESRVSGHGLGLAICRSIVLAHGGRIKVSNRRGGGARFSVLLPAKVRAKQFDSNCQAKEQSNDPAKHSRGRRRGADAQASLQQPQGKRLRRPVRSGWYGGVETHRGASVRPAAA